jgi:hypothetical protein
MQAGFQKSERNFSSKEQIGYSNSTNNTNSYRSYLNNVFTIQTDHTQRIKAITWLVTHTQRIKTITWLVTHTQRIKTITWLVIHTQRIKTKCQSKSNTGIGSINVIELRYPFEYYCIVFGDLSRYEHSAGIRFCGI